VQIFSQTFQVLERAVSNSALKHQVIASNIANVDTPNYKSKQVDFQSALSEALNKPFITSNKTNSKHIPFSDESNISQIKIKENKNTEIKSNGNNVDMDYEMAELAKNQLIYNALIDRINGKFNSLSSVINEGR